VRARIEDPPKACAYCGGIFQRERIEPRSDYVRRKYCQRDCSLAFMREYMRANGRAFALKRYRKEKRTDDAGAAQVTDALPEGTNIVCAER
jgi:hypothetical protein